MVAKQRTSSKSLIETLKGRGELIIKDASELLELLEEGGKDNCSLGIRLMNECSCFIKHTTEILEQLDDIKIASAKNLVQVYTTDFEKMEIALVKVYRKMAILF